MHSQHPSEGVAVYVAALRGLAVACSFGSLSDDMIGDQLVEKTCEPQIQDHLLLEPDLKLKDAVMIATQVEQVIK